MGNKGVSLVVLFILPIIASTALATVPDYEMELCKFDYATREPIEGWTLTLERQVNDTWVEAIAGPTGSDGCLRQPVPHGIYRASEETREGWELRELTIDGGPTQLVSDDRWMEPFALTTHGPHSLHLYNEFLSGTIRVCKWVDVTGDTKTADDFPYTAEPAWTFSILPVDGEPVSGRSGPDGCTDFTLPPGDYRVYEASKSNWSLTARYIDGERDASLTPLAAGQTRVVDFYNHPTTTCGNNITEITEDCDDGNTEDGDGCSSTCESECSVDHRTQTQGGWGSSAAGQNPGAYRDANFAAAFPDGLTIGHADGYTALFTSSGAIEAFLPQGGTPAALDANTTDPSSTSAGILAGQVTALTLSVGFDAYDPNFSPSPTPLTELELISGACAGITVQAVLDEANMILAGLESDYAPAQINDCVDMINNNFVDGRNEQQLACPGDCTDDDGDGFFAEGCGGPEDCDDTRREVNPDADEVCDNGLDDDCDGWVDTYDDECEQPECVEDDDCAPASCPALGGELEGICVNNACVYDEPPFGCITDCSDGIDNDADDLVDMNDPGCDQPWDDDETNECYEDVDCQSTCPGTNDPLQGVCIEGFCDFSDTSSCYDCDPYYAYLDYNDDSTLDEDDVAILELVVDGGSCPIGKHCDVNNDKVVDGHDLDRLELIILGLWDEGEVCGDGLDNNCDQRTDDEDEHCYMTPFCEMELVKTDDPDPVMPGQELRYTLTLTNTGTAYCTGGGVQLKEYYSPDTMYTRADPTPTSGNNHWNFGEVAPGEVNTVNVTVRVDPEAPCDGTIINKACFWTREYDRWVCVEEPTTIRCHSGPFCGDGEVNQEWEECDDGNNIGGDGCSAVCKHERAMLELCKFDAETEEPIANWTLKLLKLEDGEYVPYYAGPTGQDGCMEIAVATGTYKASEETREGWELVKLTVDGNPTQIIDDLLSLPFVVTLHDDHSVHLYNELQPFCGDGLVNQPGEQCDGSDGVGEHQACSDECLLVNLTFCGDGEVQRPNDEGTGGPKNDGFEECDGSAPAGYTCSDACVLERDPFCGDGTVNKGEECDDGNARSGDGCSSDCVIEFCGDGTINLPTEECDDGNNVSGDGCSGECILEFCGDGIVNGDEECDGDAGVPEGKVCTETCMIADAPSCGDGAVNQPWEECDGYDGTPPGYTCNEYCELSWNLTCVEAKAQGFLGGEITGANGYVWSTAPVAYDVGLAVYEKFDEVIDHQRLYDSDTGSVPADGNITLSVELPNCKYQIDLFCGEVLESLDGQRYGSRKIDWEHRGQYYCSRCGDGTTDPEEECDAGAANGEACEPSYGQSCTWCSETCELQDEVGPFCGDNETQQPEECDDGNTVDGDGCSSECTLEGSDETTITVCKWVDVSGDRRSNDDYLYTQQPGWTFTVFPAVAAASEEWPKSQRTGPDGCTVFDVPRGDYKVYEASQRGWTFTARYVDGLSDESTVTADDPVLVEFYNYPQPVCGNGNLDEGEECDDGNTANGDGCSSECALENYTIRVCKWVDETGNGKSDDDTLYTAQPGWTFALSRVGDIDAQHEPEWPKVNKSGPDGCANFYVEAGEYSLSEASRQGWQFIERYLDGELQDGRFPVQADRHVDYYNYQLPACGDGNLDEGEQCDDGNTVDGDGCSSACELEHSEPTCGDGIVNQPSEECDGTDGVQPGFLCTEECLLVPECDMEITKIDHEDPVLPGTELSYTITLRNNGGGECRCVDSGIVVRDIIDGRTSFVRADPEPDLGHLLWDAGVLGPGEETMINLTVRVSNNACGVLENQACFWWDEDPQWHCTTEETTVLCDEEPVCGNGVREAGEECDDGNIDETDGCTTACEECAMQGMRADTYGGQNEQCCSGLELEGGICNLPSATCGDGRVDEGEQCDDGNAESGDGCNSACQLENGPYCGDGVRNGDEECDGTLANGQCTECVAVCDEGYGFDGSVCAPVCTTNADCATTLSCTIGECAEGLCVYSDVAPICEDPELVLCGGPLQNLNGCGECGTGMYCEAGTCVDGACTTPVCGDGFVENGEQCDDGNTVSGDGCSSACQLEDGPFCGDGVVNGDEQCDENGANGECPASCSATCQINICTSPESSGSSDGSGGRGGGDAWCDFDADGWLRNVPSCVYDRGNRWDCNDNDASVHPRNAELCNGRDDNCDGIVDENCEGPKPIEESQTDTPVEDLEPIEAPSFEARILSENEYTVTVRNLGDDVLSNLFVELVLPETWEYSGPAFIDELQPGEEIDVTYLIVVGEEPGERISVWMRNSNIILSRDFAATIAVPLFLVRPGPVLGESDQLDIYVVISPREKMEGLEVELNVNEDRRTRHVHYIGVLDLEAEERYSQVFTYPVADVLGLNVRGVLFQRGSEISESSFIVEV